MAKKQKRPQTKPKAWLIPSTVVVLIALFVGVFAWPSSPSQAQVQNVSVTDLANATEDHIIIDVREQWEYDEGHVPGVTLIPLGELESRINEVPNDKAIYVICQSGARSTNASNILKNAGKKDIRNVQGGTRAWQQAGLALER